LYKNNKSGQGQNANKFLHRVCIYHNERWAGRKRLGILKKKFQAIIFQYFTLSKYLNSEIP
jgi:hypothetical protein